MKRTGLNLRRAARPICLAAGLTASLGAVAEDSIFSFNGFGNQDYRESSANSYEGADKRGTWEHNLLGLTVSAKLNDKARAWAELLASNADGTAINWVFIDYEINSNLKAHAGRVKLPFGIYNEDIDIKALHLAATDPVVYDAAADMTHDAYSGAGLDWSNNAKNIVLEGFYGNFYTPGQASPNTAIGPGFIDRRLIGGRLVYNTPVEGLRVMLSGNQSQVESTAVTATLGQLGKENRVMYSVDYEAHGLDLKSEYSRHTVPALSGSSGLVLHGYYAQAGYNMEKWTPYVRYDYVTTDESRKSDPNYYQKSVLIGVGYKLQDGLNLRAEEHFNRGYALPFATKETATQLNWRTFIVSINFMF